MTEVERENAALQTAVREQQSSIERLQRDAADSAATLELRLEGHRSTERELRRSLQEA